MTSLLRSGLRAFKQTIHERTPERFAVLAQGQAPKVCLITCSDARLVPSMITQTDPGEVFVIRNPGNVVPKPGGTDNGVIAGLEYAVNALHVREIIVCGHSDCGAIKALTAMPTMAHKLPQLHAYLQEHFGDDFATDGPLNGLIQQGVQRQLTALAAYDFIAEAVAHRRLSLHGWFYDIGCGRVTDVLSQQHLN